MNETPTPNSPYTLSGALPPGAHVAHTAVRTVEDNKIKTITINEVSRGYTVAVGCQTFAFEKPQELLIYLGMYLREPYKIEQKWFAGNLFE